MGLETCERFVGEIKRDRGREKVENSSYHHTDICAFYLNIISHVYLNEETEGKGVR